MAASTAIKILSQARNLGVPSIKLNWRGESTLNPNFEAITLYAKSLGFTDRISNSNFNFDTNNEEIFRAFCNQTTVKISFDSFMSDVFLAQRQGANHQRILDNIDKFYHYRGRDNKIIIQMVRTEANKNENFKDITNKLWPDAYLSIRDVVPNRVGGGSDYTGLVLADKKRLPCYQAYARLIFAHDGQATPCCPDIETGLLSTRHNINIMTLKEIWNSYALHSLRRGLKTGSAFENPICKNCSSLESYEGYKHNWNS
jgi:hypothetical protein